jgi:hypothetical protein
MNKYPNQIVSFTRHPRSNQLNGCIVAAGKNQVGWSLCHLSLDKFDKERAYQIALNRAVTGSVVPVPHSQREAYNKVVERATRYFRN